jgi:hypothetical protein
VSSYNSGIKCDVGRHGEVGSGAAGNELRTVMVELFAIDKPTHRPSPATVAPPLAQGNESDK